MALTPNEWIKAQRFGKDYWLYVVVTDHRPLQAGERHTVTVSQM